MTHHADPAVQAAHVRWHESVLRHVDHRLGCQAGCSPLRGDVCPTGLTNKAVERETWRAYYGVRIAAGVEMPA